jgi:hypothetical protein
VITLRSIAVSPELCVAAAEFDLAPLRTVKRFLLCKAGCTNYTPLYYPVRYNSSQFERAPNGSPKTAQDLPAVNKSGTESPIARTF